MKIRKANDGVIYSPGRTSLRVIVSAHRRADIRDSGIRARYSEKREMKLVRIGSEMYVPGKISYRIIIIDAVPQITVYPRDLDSPCDLYARISKHGCEAKAKKWLAVR